MMNAHDMTRTLTTLAATGALLFGWPDAAAAQRVQIDVKASTEFSRELRDALHDVTRDVGEAIRTLSRELGQGLGQLDRGLGRELGRSLRDLPDLSHLKVLDGGWALAQERNWNGRAEDRHTRTLAIGANGALELRNLSGDITVTAGSGREATVEVIRRSRGRTDADARLGLERVKVDQQLTGSRATIRADYPNERQAPYSVSVAFNVVAPAGTRVVINSVSADLKVTGILGELSANTISGDVTLTNVGSVSEAKTASGDVTIVGASGDTAINVSTLNGDVTLKHIKARSISASTISGGITGTDIVCESVTFNAMAGDTSFSGDLARNGRYEISSHSGDVHFAPSGGVGFALTASSFAGDVTSSLSLQSDGSRTRSRKLSGTVGDGSATVSLQTFSGDIRVGSKK